MTPSLAFPLPERPRLRSLEPRWIEIDGEPRLWLRDPLELGEGVVLVPEALVPLLGLLDGGRDHETIGREFARRTSVSATVAQVRAVLAELDEALLLDSPRARWAGEHALAAYRSAPFRPPALAGRGYPAQADDLDATLAVYRRAWRERGGGRKALDSALAKGVLSPHIDFRRGGPLYAGTWEQALPAVAEAEVVVLFGTDHMGGAGRLTPTRQRYATPWGALDTDVTAVEALAAAMGDKLAFDEELHHRREHSIELASVWLHWALREAGRPTGDVPLVLPILCGSFFCYLHPELGDDGAAALPEDDAILGRALDALASTLEGRRALVVAAADLAHIGPAFGDPHGLTAPAREELAARDAALLRTLTAGDASAFLEQLRAEHDDRRVCGLPPIYWSMRLLERLYGAPPRGTVVGYDQCPADADGGSVVTIAGALWR